MTTLPTLPTAAARALRTNGFVVLPGPWSSAELARLQAAYDSACANASPQDARVGRSSTRVIDFVNRGTEFELIYAWPPVLEAARQVVAGPFRLSAFHARTLHPGAAAQALHTDLPRTSDAWPMLGVIVMIDEFRRDNGATRFVAGSHRWPERPEDLLADRVAPHPAEVSACGLAGSVILFDASTWHGHTANISSSARRSLQATFIPRTGRPATDFVGRMPPQRLARLGALAREVLGLDPVDDAAPA